MKDVIVIQIHQTQIPSAPLTSSVSNVNVSNKVKQR